MVTELRVLLLLLTIPNFGCVKIYNLIKKIDTISQLLTYNQQQLMAVGFNTDQIKYILKPNWDFVDKQLALAKRLNIDIISILDSAYPALLKEIYDPPMVLYVQGNKQALNSMQIAVVGSRKPTLYGKQVAEYFCNELLAYGYTLTSGFALGIDIIAHCCALKNKMPTVVVLGTSLDAIYPAKHKEYVPAIIDAGGAIISENSFTTRAHPSVFPRRNRIISGLSRGVLVVEAARKSGTLITARCATEQFREVFAIPGNINNPKALGCLDLIANGAKLVIEPRDIIEELCGIKINYKKKSVKNPEVKQPAQQDLLFSELSPQQKSLLAALSGGLSAFDTLVENSALSPEQVAGELIQLEIKGYIAEVAGGYVRLAV